MRPVSAAFLRTITGSHQAIFRATVCTTFQTGTTPTGTEIAVIDGDVKIDGTADVRSTLDLLVDGTRSWPKFADDLYAPYGNEIFIERGVQYSDALVEWVGLGYFRIDQPEQDQPADGPIRISGSDRMAGIIDARLLAPQQFAIGASLGSIMSTLVLDVYPSATILWPDGGDTDVISSAAITTEDRFGFLNDLVTSAGKIWFWDYAGQLVIKDVPDPTDPVASILCGKDGLMMGSNRKLSRAGVYNAVVASSEAADTVTPVRAVAIDDDANSPTRYGGPFGKVPTFFSSPLLSTVDQCRRAANSMLKQNLGLPYSVDLSLSPNPALEPFDPVNVQHHGRELAEVHVIDTLTIPLVAGAAMDATTRQQTITLIGSF